MAGEKSRRDAPRLVLLVGASSRVRTLRRRGISDARRAHQGARGSGGGGRDRLGYGSRRGPLRRASRPRRSRDRGAEPLQQVEGLSRLAGAADEHPRDSAERRRSGNGFRSPDRPHARDPRRDIHQSVDARVRSRRDWSQRRARAGSEARDSASWSTTPF